MKAISLLQPWASLVIMGVKTIETRSWNTKYRGKILIHASLGKTGSIFASSGWFKKYIPHFKELPFGAIIGSVNVVDVILIEDLGMKDDLINKLTKEEKAFGDYTSGRYAWLLSDPKPLKVPVKARGMLSIWEYPDQLIKGVK